MASEKKRSAKNKKVFTSKTGENLELPPLPPLPKLAARKKKSVFSIFHTDKKPDALDKKEKNDLKIGIFDRLSRAEKDKKEPLIPPAKKESRILSFLSKPKKVKLDKFKADTKVCDIDGPKKARPDNNGPIKEIKKEPKANDKGFLSFLKHDKNKVDRPIKPEVKGKSEPKKKEKVKGKPAEKKEGVFSFFKSEKKKEDGPEAKKKPEQKIPEQVKEISKGEPIENNMVLLAKPSGDESAKDKIKDNKQGKKEGVGIAIRNVLDKIQIGKPPKIKLGKPVAKVKLRDVLEPELRKKLEPKIPQIKVVAPKPGKLLIKKHVLEDKEVHLSEKEKHLENKEKELSKKEKEHISQTTRWLKERDKRESMIQGLDESLKEKKAQIESHALEFKTTDRRLKKLISDIKRYRIDIRKAEHKKRQLENAIKKVDDKRKAELDNLQKKLQIKKELVKAKETDLKQRESAVIKKEKEFSVKENQWRTDKERRISKLDELESLVKEVSAQFDQLKKDHDLQKNNFESDVNKYSKRVAELKKQVLEDENAIKQIEDRKRSIDESMAERENKLRESENASREREIELNKKESRLLEREDRLRDKDIAIKENLIPLNDMRKNIEDNMIEFSKRLTEVKKERMLKDDILRKNKEFFMSIEPTVIKKVKQVEADEAMLDQEEQRITNKVDELNKATVRAQKAEASLAVQKKIQRDEDKRIKDEQKRLDKESRDIERKLMRINKVKELKSNIPMLEKKYKQLQSLVGKEQVNLSKITREAIAKREYLKDKEAEIAKREIEEKEREEWLTHLKSRMINERRDLEEGKFHDYMKHELNEEEKKIFEGDQDLPNKEPGIYDMIRQARGLINSKNIAEAKRLIDQIQKAYSSTNYDEQEKKKIYYEILELSTDLKLLALS